MDDLLMKDHTYGNDDAPTNKRPKRSSSSLVLLGLLGVGVVVGVFFIGRSTAPKAQDSPAPPQATSVQCLAPGEPAEDGAYCAFQVHDDLAGHPEATASGTPYLKGSKRKESKDDVGIRRVEFETVTVDDMDMALKYYKTMLGGVEVDFCVESGVNMSYCLPGGGVRFRGEAHSAALFGYELSLGESQSVADIVSDDGGYEVHSRFLVFGNAVVQLMQFAAFGTNHSSSEDSKPYFDLREKASSPCMIGAAHMCFWIEDGLDMNDYIDASETTGAANGMVNLAWNRPVPQETRADRAKVPKSKWANKVPVGETGGAFGGLEWAYYKGPVGEELELYKISETMKAGIGRAYCDRGATSPAFLWDEDGKKDESSKPVPAQIHGVFQYGFRTDNLHAAVGFYTEVLGGDLVTYPTHGINIRGDDAQWMIMANETIEAYEEAARNKEPRDVALTRLGVGNISTAGPMRLDHRFILFDNFVVEPLLYTHGLSFGGKVFEPRWNHTTSPAYIGTVSAAFGVTSSSDLPKTLESVKQLGIDRGFPDVWIPTTPAGFPSDHPFSGLEYAYAKGQSFEAIAFVKVAGRFQAALKKAFIEAGTVSTMFEETDAFEDGRMDEFCQSVISNTYQQKQD